MTYVVGLNGNNVIVKKDIQFFIFFYALSSYYLQGFVLEEINLSIKFCAIVWDQISRLYTKLSKIFVKSLITRGKSLLQSWGTTFLPD